MKTTGIITVALALAMAMTASPTGAENVEWISIGVDANGETLVNVGPGEGDHFWQCDTQAIGGSIAGLPVIPDNPVCGPENHPDGWSWSMTIGFPNPNGDVTGTTVVIVESGSGVVEFACKWNAGAFQSCQVRSAQWPAPGTAFDSSCHSEFLTLGAYSCYVSHI